MLQVLRCLASNVGTGKSKYDAFFNALTYLEQEWTNCLQCDRIYPCSPCVSRGRSADCLFENAGTAVDQAQAIKNHRKQEERLLRRINELEQFIHDHHSDASIAPLNSLHAEGSPRSAKGARSRKTRNHPDSSSLFFGDLSLARLIEEVCDIHDAGQHDPLRVAVRQTRQAVVPFFADTYDSSITEHLCLSEWCWSCVPVPMANIRRDRASSPTFTVCRGDLSPVFPVRTAKSGMLVLPYP